MLELEARGCENINFVTPTHFIAQIIEALQLAAERGFRLPLVYNTSGYERIETLKLLDGIIDIYMPDIKYVEEKQAATIPNQTLPGHCQSSFKRDAKTSGRFSG